MSTYVFVNKQLVSFQNYFAYLSFAKESVKDIVSLQMSPWQYNTVSRAACCPRATD